jgi:small subunit ribosomal protein S6
MYFYENIFILDPNLDETSVANAVGKVRDIVTKNGGEVLKEENWGHKKLAFKLKKQNKGVYILLVFKAPPTVILELERYYKVLDSLLKFLVIKLNKKQTEALMSSLAETADKPATTEPAHKPATTEPADKPASTEPAHKFATTEPADKPVTTEPADKP